MRLFGPNTQRVLAFLAGLRSIPGGFRESGERLAASGRLGPCRSVGELHRAASDRERYQILAAASVARREALDVANRHQWHDSSFWSAASDAAAAIAARDWIGRYYQTLIFPLSAVMPWLPPVAGDVRSGKDSAARYLPSDDALEQGA